MRGISTPYVNGLLCVAKSCRNHFRSLRTKGLGWGTKEGHLRERRGDGSEILKRKRGSALLVSISVERRQLVSANPEGWRCEMPAKRKAETGNDGGPAAKQAGLPETPARACHCQSLSAHHVLSLICGETLLITGPA